MSPELPHPRRRREEGLTFNTASAPFGTPSQDLATDFPLMNLSRLRAHLQNAGNQLWFLEAKRKEDVRE